MATLAVTGTPPFGLFQSELKILSAALAGGHSWAALLFIAGVVAIFAGFLVHMAKMNLGAGQLVTGENPPAAASPGLEFRWQYGAMALVTIFAMSLSFWLPGPFYNLLEQAAGIIGGTQ